MRAKLDSLAPESIDGSVITALTDVDGTDGEDEWADDECYSTLSELPPVRRITRATVQKPAVRPPQFDTAMPFEHYKRLYEDAAAMNGWNEFEMARYLPQVLPSTAYETVANIATGAAGAYRRMISALTRRFGASVNVGRSQALLEARRQKENEDPSAYAQALQTLAGWAYPGMEASSIDVMLKTRFMAGLRDRGLARWISGFEPRTLDEAVNKAVMLGAIPEDPRGGRGKGPQKEREFVPWVGQTRESDQKHGGGARTAQRGKGGSPNKGGDRPKKAVPERDSNGSDQADGDENARPPFKGTCYECGEEGHMGRDCEVRAARMASRKGGRGGRGKAPFRRKQEGNVNPPDSPDDDQGESGDARQ